MPLTPLTSRSSKIRVCSAAVPSAGILNSSLTFGTSLTACSQPARAIVQKSDGLLVKNARLRGLESPKAAGEKAAAAASAHKSAVSVFVLFIFLGGGVGYETI